MTKYSREGQFKIEQRKDETVDMVLIRCFMKAVPYMTPKEGRAAANWIASKAADRKTWR